MDRAAHAPGGLPWFQFPSKLDGLTAVRGVAACSVRLEKRTRIDVASWRHAISSASGCVASTLCVIVWCPSNSLVSTAGRETYLSFPTQQLRIVFDVDNTYVRRASQFSSDSPSTPVLMELSIDNKRIAKTPLPRRRLAPSNSPPAKQQ